MGFLEGYLGFHATTAPKFLNLVLKLPPDQG